MPELHETLLGRRFYESHVPDIVDSLNTIAKELRTANELKKNKMNRDMFMEFFRREDFLENISVEDAHEVFCNVLHGSSDLTPNLIKELFGNYAMEFDEFFEIRSGHVDNDSFDSEPTDK
jgi:hypothetical protein